MSQLSKAGGWNIPANWVWIDVASIANTTSGGTPRRDRPEYYGGQIPWLKSGELRDRTVLEVEEYITEEGLRNSNAKVFPPGTLCIALYGATVGKLAILGLASATNQAICGIFPAAGVDPRFLFRFFELIRPQLIELGKGGAQSNISQGVVRSTFLPLAPSNEQTRIVAEIEKQFTRLDAAAAAIRRVQANLTRYRAAVLKVACEGRLVPTEAQLARENGRSYETGDQLLARIIKGHRTTWEEAQLARMHASSKLPKNEEWKQKYNKPATPQKTNLPELPEGWGWATIGQLVGLEENSITDGPFGSNLKTEHYTDIGPRVVRLQNIGDGVFRDAEAHISEDHFKKLRRHAVYPGDVVIAALGDPAPRACLVPEIGPAIVKADCIRFRSAKGVLQSFVMFALNSDAVRKRTAGRVHGVGRPRLNLQEIKEIVIPLPPTSEQERIVEELDRHWSAQAKAIEALTSNLARAAGLRQSILKRAFEGKLVPQDPNVEPASVLLERIEAARSSMTSRPIATKSTNEKPEEPTMSEAGTPRPIVEVLRERKTPVSPEELLKAAGYSVDTIDEFYAGLKSGIDGGHILETRSAGDTILLQAR